MTYVPGNGYPSLADIRAYIAVPATVVDDTILGWVAGAEQVAQVHAVDVALGAELPDDLHQAFMRRVARHLAARSVPLGLIGLDNEYGASRLVRWDAEVDRLEAPHVMPVVS
jgi:hypothetical protein